MLEFMGFGFENPEILLLLLFNLPMAYILYRRKDRSKRLVAAGKMLAVSLLIVAAAAPYMNMQESVMKKPEIVLLQDNSRSASLMNDPELDLGNVKVRKKVIAAGNESDLRKGILRNLEPNTAYLLSSDLQSKTSLDGVAKKFIEKNSTLSAIKPSMKQDVSITIKGPSSTVPGADNTFRIVEHSTNRSVKPRVYLDGNPVTLEKNDDNLWSFSRSFSKVGKHSIEARLDVNDTFSSNNRYYSTVRVREKPEILVVGEKGALGDKMKKFYDVKYSSNVPTDLSDYYSVIAKHSFDASELADYVAKGNGLVYTGDYSNDNYLLPVKKSPDSGKSKGARIMIVIDLSKSTKQTTAHKRSVQIAYSLVDQLPYNNEVGAIAYNQDAYLLSKPKPLGQNRQELLDKISRLESSGNSFHHVGLKGAKKALDGKGNIIMITDGKISAYGRNVDTEQKSKDIASSLDTRLITVGVGENRNKQFLQDLADLGNGFYLDAGQSGRLNFVFEAGGAKDKANGLIVVDKNHFITDGLETSSRTSGFDDVKLKPGADLLVTSNDGRPFLSSWHYGLGRVAAYSGGSKDLSHVLNTDPLLISRSVSWTVGAPQRKKDHWLSIEDSRAGEKVNVRASYSIDGLTRQGEDLYTGTLNPESTGFNKFKGEIYGYSYNPELQGVGYSDQLEEVTRKTGGQVYTPGEEKEIKNDLKTFTERKIDTRKPLSSLFILAGLIIFLGEIGYRKRRGMK